MISQHQSNSLADRELKLIASSFVKQYYTLLNKAPCYIHNFYNHDSTFIHGTIEMGSENHTEPVVGRARIGDKMKELKLNDCRAKIKQIDCLETLAGGLVIQVIGELSNNGKPMRRFLQTFVLAPSPDSGTSQARHDSSSDSHGSSHRPNDNRRGVQINEGTTPNSSHNQKFYVLNSIFRYQDDGPDSEFEDDSVSVQANTSLDSANAHVDQANAHEHNSRLKTIVITQSQPQQQQQQSHQPSQPQKPMHQQPMHQQPMQQQHQQLNPSAAAPVLVNSKSVSKQPTLTLAENAVEQKRGDVKPAASNGTTNPDKKSETSEKPLAENGKSATNDNQSLAPTPVIVAAVVQAGNHGTPGATTTSQTPLSGAVTTTPATRPSNEPKTWANMVRNTPFPSSIQQTTATVIKEQPSPSVSSTNPAQAPPQQQQIPQQHHHQQQSSQQSQSDQSQQNNNNNNNNNNNRRRHMIRKTTNKAGNNGRMIKNNNRPPRPAAPPAPGPAAAGKPAA